MKVGIYCNNFSDLNLRTSQNLIAVLEKRGVSFCILEALNDALRLKIKNTFSKTNLEKSMADVLITIGGDGTILSAVPIVTGKSIPIMGVNTGRLGFLTSIAPEEFDKVLEDLVGKNYSIEERALLEMKNLKDSSGQISYALNEISVLKKDSSAMIAIHADIDNEFLNTYWADGLIISTATGSTAYSLSCGGPIVVPGSGNLIITPIAPHNLNVRPLVLADNQKITLSFHSRSSDLLIAVDSTSRIIQDSSVIEIVKSKKNLGLVRLKDYSYLETLRKKLNWGLDLRN